MPPTIRPTLTDPSGNTGFTEQEIYFLYCNATKADRTPCNYRSVSGRGPDFAPVCKRHLGLRIPQGICKGVDDVGPPCGQHFVLKPGTYPLCSLHEDQYTSMPCYLLQLPVELITEIVRHVAPQSYSDRAPKKREIRRQYCSIMRIHPTITSEATKVFYRETPFEIVIENNKVMLFGHVWKPTFLKRNMQDLIAACPLIPFYLMREFNVFIKVKSCSLAHHWTGVKSDEGTVSDKCREMCHAVTEFLSSFPNIRKLEVCLAFPDTFESLNAVLAAPYILSPFLRLRRVRRPTLHALRIGWKYAEIGTIHPTTNFPLYKASYPQRHMKSRTFEKFQEDFANLLKRDELPVSRPATFYQFEALLNLLGAMGCFFNILHGNSMALCKIFRTACHARDMNDSASLTSLCNSLKATFKVQRDFEDCRWNRFNRAANECTSPNTPSASFQLRFRDIVSEQPPTLCVNPMAYTSVLQSAYTYPPFNGEVEDYWVLRDGLVLVKFDTPGVPFRVVPYTIGIAIELAHRLGTRLVSMDMYLEVDSEGVVCAFNGDRHLVEFPALVAQSAGVRPEA